MKVPFVHGPGDLRLDEIDAPVAGPDDVVVRIARAGICGSDIGYVAMGGVAGPSDRPVPLGHELAGTIAQVGEAVEGFAVGQRVIVNPTTNLIGNGGPEGGFAEHLLVRGVADQAGALLPIPDHVAFEDAALVEPLAVGAHAANRSGAGKGDRVAVFGAGPIGLATIINLKRNGVDHIVSIDLSAFRRERALVLGADAVIDPRAEDVADALKRLHGTAQSWFGEMAATSRYIEASGAPVIGDILAMAAPGAGLCVVSVQKKPVQIDFQQLLARELTITTACAYGDEFAQMLDLVGSGAVDVGPMVSHRFQGGDFLAAFAIASDPERAAKVLVEYS
ncbi:zinc-dependent alcohol dehydrogenase [Sphingomonas montanisoli]|uniref:Alcohol dehydrogenase catalytic domain-containing protein n=1 Tax=Sphingomonas montanisoli TaxID=2606412 RepID=A0A5D9CF01_9SPHN|nr:alcohol dehydrogenase catalytic domain-containing protein [Sphingomonas montanisoli]TZG29580.1 alcohol dehydrogenase catalytic domain-containing protein [Sphingomonas montanisoli]